MAADVDYNRLSWSGVYTVPCNEEICDLTFYRLAFSTQPCKYAIRLLHRRDTFVCELQMVTMRNWGSDLENPAPRVILRIEGPTVPR